MRWAAKWQMRFRSLFLRRQVEAELDEEMRDHLEQEIQSNMGAGMSPEEARLAAKRLAGPISLYKEQCRDARGTSTIENLARDARYGVRSLGHSPLFASIATVTLALGIGANTTVFTFVENVILRPLPARNPDQLVSVNWNGMVNMSYPNYVDFRDRNTTFSHLISFRLNPVNLSQQPGNSWRAWGYEASGNYFETLGIRPELGRFFTSGEDRKPGANPVVVLSDGFWRSRFGADGEIIGRAVKINGFPFTVIGIAPPWFSGTELIVAADYWVPMSMEAEVEPGNDWLQDRGSQEVWTMGRLKPGVSHAQAEADLNRIAQELKRIYPNAVGPGSFKLTRPGLIGQALRGPVTSFGVVFLGIAGMTLLIACINLAGMLMARASDRHREIGIRLALGASRFQIVRQLIIESLLLALGGGALGLAIAFGACALFSSWSPGFDIPVNNKLRPDAAVLLFTVCAALFTTLLFGLVPALQAVRVDLMPSLKNEPRSARFRKLTVRDVLVAGQLALSVALVICSVLVVRSLQHALSLNLGFNPQRAVAVSFDLRLQGYNDARSRRFDAELLERASTLAGLQSVGIISNLPLRLGETNDVISRADRPMPPRSEWRPGIIYNISPGYLRAAGTRLLLGRDVDNRDREEAPHVAIVNEALAQVIYGRENALGKGLRLGSKVVEIVGIVETGKYQSLGEDPQPAVFLPIAQTGTAWTTLVARTRMPAQQATELLRKAVLSMDRNVPLFNAGSLEEQLALPLFPARAAAIVLVVFGVLALVLAATGLFALVAYSVARRIREIGIRMALGAQPAQVLISVLRRTVIICSIGLAIGTALTLAAGRLLSAVLYGISPRDPMTYLTALVLVMAVALAACWNPAARAMRIDPATILRQE